MAFVKYKVADNAMAKLALPLDENTTHMTIKDAVNIPESWIWIATLAEYEGDQLVRMEKVKVSNKNWNVLTIERGFESNPLQREIDTPVFLNVTAEVIRDIQEAIEQGNPESERNKKQSIEPNKSSNLFYPTIKAVYDWVTGLLGGKADLIEGKVPASQLPEVQAIDERNLVHKSGDETITGIKTFSGGIKIDRWNGIKTTDSLGNEVEVYRNSLASPNNHHHILPDVKKAENGGTGIFIGYGGEHNELWLCIGGGWPVLLLQKDKSLTWNNQNRTGEWQDYTPTLSGSWGGTPAKYWSQRWRYKIIWKMCFWWAKVEFQKWTLSGRPYISLPNKSKWEWESIGAESLVWWTGTTLKNTYWYASINDGKIEILHWFGQAGDWSAIESWDMAISVKFFYEIE